MIYKKIKAFTLIEMIIVIIIMAILIGSLSYFKTNNDPIKNQKDFGIKAAKDIYNTIKSDHLNTIRKQKKQFGNKQRPIEYMKIYADKNPSSTLKIDIIYGDKKIYPPTQQTLTYKNNKYANIVIGFESPEKNQIKINNQNIFTLSNMDHFETQSCDTNLKNCMPISKIYFNKAAQTITQKFCSKIQYTTKGGYECLDPDRENNSQSSNGSSSTNISISL